MDADIDDVFFSPVALTAAQVHDLMDGTASRSFH